MDVADMADLERQPKLDAAIQTAHNIAKSINVEGTGFCEECGEKVQKVRYAFPVYDEATGEVIGYEKVMIYPRWCIGTECRDYHDKAVRLSDR